MILNPQVCITWSASEVCTLKSLFLGSVFCTTQKWENSGFSHPNRSTLNPDISSGLCGWTPRGACSGCSDRLACLVQLLLLFVLTECDAPTGPKEVRLDPWLLSWLSKIRGLFLLTNVGKPCCLYPEELFEVKFRTRGAVSVSDALPFRLPLPLWTLLSGVFRNCV